MVRLLSSNTKILINAWILLRKLRISEELEISMNVNNNNTVFLISLLSDDLIFLFHKIFLFFII